jgi:hypothetical protein
VAWLAGVTGSPRPVLHARVVEPDARRFGPPPLAVPQVAAAVDDGRDRAGHAAAQGVNVLVGRGRSPHAADLAAWLAGTLERDDIRGPLGALRRLGDAQLCVLVGLALGAGEHGLGFVADGQAAATAADLAAAVEPDLRPRLL